MLNLEKKMQIFSIHLIAFTVSGSFFGLICMILSIAIGDMWNKMISVGIVWYLPLWCICILVSFNIQTDIWIPTCYICSIFAACVSLAGFGYEIASLVSVVDDFGSRMRVPDCIYITSSVIMLIDLLAVMVLLCIGKAKIEFKYYSPVNTIRVLQEKIYTRHGGTFDCL